MRRLTTTKQLQQAITDNLLHIAKVEKYNKSTRQTDVVDAERFKDSLDFICETIFSDSIGWHYEFDYKTGGYEIDCGRMNGDSDVIIIAYLCANDGVSGKDIDKVLRMIEEE